MNADEIKNDPRNRIDLVIARYVDLHARGSILKALCPFHSEKTPSFVVYPDEGRFKCYGAGCGVSGDVITFIKLIHNVDFVEACRILGGEQTELPPLKKAPPKVEQSVIEIGPRERLALTFAARVYHAALWVLPARSKPREYLQQRLMDPDDLRRFQVGWCSGKELLPAARMAGIKTETLLRAGLIRPSKSGGFYEFLSRRIVLTDGGPDGVSYMVGRTLGDSEIKYLGLAGLPKPVFGLVTLDRQQPTAITEGWFCRFSLMKRGVQALATMGTALQGARADPVRTIPHLWFVPQNDVPDADGNRPGHIAAAQWAKELGDRHVAWLPDGVKDVNEFHMDDPEGYEEWLDTWATWRKT